MTPFTLLPWASWFTFIGTILYVILSDAVRVAEEWDHRDDWVVK